MITIVNNMMFDQIKVRMIDCGIDRIVQCIDRLDEHDIHYRPNKNCNSINNLILHLDGNVRQWLIATFSDQQDQRNRPLEFDYNNKKSKADLVRLLHILKNDILSISKNITSCSLDDIVDVQCYRETKLSVIIHVIEHFSYHVGQITYITKMIKDIDTGYYASDDLEKINS